jgi:hypothetical protein
MVQPGAMRVAMGSGEAPASAHAANPWAGTLRREGLKVRYPDRTLRRAVRGLVPPCNWPEETDPA